MVFGPNIMHQGSLDMCAQLAAGSEDNGWAMLDDMKFINMAMMHMMRQRAYIFRVILHCLAIL